MNPFEVQGGGVSGRHHLHLRRAGLPRGAPGDREPGLPAGPGHPGGAGGRRRQRLPEQAGARDAGSTGGRSTCCGRTPPTPSSGRRAARLTLPSALVKHAPIARILFDLFRARFDPTRPTRWRTACGVRGRARRVPERSGQRGAPLRRPGAAPHVDPRERHGADQLLPLRCSHPHASVRAACPTCRSSSPPRSSRPSAEPAPVRDLGALVAHGGRAPAGGDGGPGRHPLERPPRRLPHRGPRAWCRPRW